MASIDETKRSAQATTDALNSTGNAGAIAAQLIAAGIISTIKDDQERLGVRTTALNAAATLTAGMSAEEVQEDHDSREHDPLSPVSDVIALAGEFEAWLQRAPEAPEAPDAPDAPDPE